MGILVYTSVDYSLAVTAGGVRTIRASGPSGEGGGHTQLWMRGGGGGIGLVRPSSCGSLLFAAGTGGPLRVWETRSWCWQTWRRFGAPCTAAAWGGPAPLGSDAPRVLLFTVGAEPVLHALPAG